jgi:hypothetical protein
MSIFMLEFDLVKNASSMHGLNEAGGAEFKRQGRL